MAVDVIVTVRGGEDITDAVIAGGALLGFNSGDVEPPHGSPQFIDWPHYKHSRVPWRHHIEMVRKYQPRYAVAPDAGGDWSFEWVLDRADVLSQYANRVIVPVKTVHPSEVPDRFRVGLPFASSDYSGGLDHPLSAYQGRPIHVLGGDPDRIYRTFFGPQADAGWIVRSFDTSRPYLLAEKGQVWDPTYNRVDRHGLDLRERIALTTFNLRVAVNGRERDTINYEQLHQSGRVPPIPPSSDLLRGTEYERMVQRFERIMGETPDEFRRQQAGPNALRDDDLPPISDPAFDRYQTPDDQRQRPQSRAPVTDDDQDDDDARVDPDQSELSEYGDRTLSPGERAMREYLDSDDEDDDDDGNGQSSLTDYVPDGGVLWA